MTSNVSVRFKLDENLPRDAAWLLREMGQEVHTVWDEGLGGRADAKIFDVCQQEQRTLITFDLDFADIRQYPPSSHRGIWVLRPHTQSIGNTLELLRQAFRVLGIEQVEQRLWLIEPSQVRIRE